MKNALAFLFLLLMISVSQAGTITFTLTTASGACQAGCTQTFTDTDANMLRIAAALQPQCNASISGTCTTLQVVQYWYAQTIAGIISQVSGFDKTNLTTSAIVGYTPINPH